eukprot:SAG31_NODE_34509_length_332_cov_0.866953_1_plen_23_part_01
MQTKLPADGTVVGYVGAALVFLF